MSAVRKISSARVRAEVDRLSAELKEAQGKIKTLEAEALLTAERLERAGMQLAASRVRVQMRSQIAESLNTLLTEAEKKTAAANALLVEEEKKTAALMRDNARKLESLRDATAEAERVRHLWKGAEAETAHAKLTHRRLMDEINREVASLKESVRDREVQLVTREAVLEAEIEDLQHRGLAMTDELERERAAHLQLRETHRQMEDSCRAIISSLVQRGLLPPDYIRFMPPPPPSSSTPPE